jgi:WD40 repeat protein/serine/threonine protein kinase
MSERAIFIAALEKDDPAERAAFLDEACADDRPLRQRIERLLKAHEPADSFLEHRPPGLGGTVDEQPRAERHGTVIGPYKLLQQIGEGGMGVVYMAEQQEPLRRRVALKIIKPGMDSAQVIARFEAERQALALMDHQNIAKVLDAGTTESGRPYFVMELVHGIPITQYCDDHHLTPKERLELFLPVCHAVQHAHQKGIIHRDLKPSNVLVCLYDGVAVPKVIDFGIAKATGSQLTERTMFTQFGTLVGTLEYMSPEQAEMSQLGIDTRSDVYSLGVLLYELLTGTTPLQRHRLREAGFDEIRRLIREEEPPRPSTRLSTSGVALAAISAQRQTEPAKLTRLVRGELDWIVMKALEKDRNRRYESANGLARDVERYLHDEPVEACPPSAGYKLRKFARKHKAGLATVTAFVAVLVLGTAVSAWQAVRATQAEAVALANEQQANTNAVQAEEKEQQANEQRDEAQRQRDEVRALNERLRRTLYAAHINLAKSAWEAGDIRRVQELLDHHRPKPGESDLRGFEWDYLYRQCHAEILTLHAGGDPLSVAFSPDGKRLACASGIHVRVWDAQTGEVLRTLKGGTTSGVTSVAFSPDGKRLASTCGDKTVKVWDARTGEELLSLKRRYGDEFPGDSVAFSQDGKCLASASFTRDNTKKAYVAGEVKVWDAQTGQELLVLQRNINTLYLAFSPDGKRLAGPDDKTVKIWEAQTGQELLALKGHRKAVSSVAYSPDGKRLASASEDQTVKVWDAQTGQELLSFKGHTRDVSSVAFSPDGKRLASAEGNGPNRPGEVKVWDAQTGQELLTIKGYAHGDSVTFSPDGKRLASCGWNGTVKVWDAQTDQKQRTLPGAAASSIADVAISPDGKHLALSGSGRPGSAPGVLEVWDAQTSQKIFTLQGHTATVTSAAYSHDGRRLASASEDKTVKVWDAQTGRQLFTLQRHSHPVWSVAFSSDGKRLASASGADDNLAPGELPGELKVWDAQTGQELLTIKGHPKPARSVTFSPDGKRLAGAGGEWSKPGEVKLWDAQTGQELLTFKGHIRYVGSVAFSPDGKRLASASGDGTVRVWEAQTGHELLICKGHSGVVGSVAFSPDGKRLASGSTDQTVKVWDVQTGQELLTLKGHTEPVTGVAFSPDGHWLASGAEDGTVTIWDATPPVENPRP